MAQSDLNGFEVEFVVNLEDGESVGSDIDENNIIINSDLGGNKTPNDWRCH